MELYIKDGIIKSKSQIILYSTIYDEELEEEIEMQTINPSHDMLIESGWVVYEPKLTLEQIRETKIGEVISHDKSSDVNEFYISNMPMWLSREERIVIKDRFEREIEAGITKTKLRYNGLSIELDPVLGVHMINALSSYADACFDVTEDHKANIKSLTTIEEIEAYDYTIGYPDKLTFEL